MLISRSRRRWKLSDLLVSKADRHLLRKYQWSSGEYINAKSGGRKIYLHRLIAKAGPGQEVDHINGNKLDNRRRNLRLCTRAENIVHWIRKRPGNNPCTGVHFDKRLGRWTAYITKDYKRRHLGVFSSLTDAVSARNKAARKLFGRFASISREDGA